MSTGDITIAAGLVSQEQHNMWDAANSLLVLNAFVASQRFQGSFSAAQEEPLYKGALLYLTLSLKEGVREWPSRDLKEISH